MAIPAIQNARHASFVWGKTPAEAALNAAVLEEVAMQALQAQAIHPGRPSISDSLRDKHFRGKPGLRANYGRNRQPVLCSRA